MPSTRRPAAMFFVVSLFVLFIALAAPLLSRAADAPKPFKNENVPDVAGSDAAKKHLETFKGRGEVGDFNVKPLSVEDSLKTFEVAEGFKVETVLAEPDVMQPLHISFDERGRMWVVEYRQYPYPAGLKIVRSDEHLRAIFDKVPQPPGHPDHVKGADRISIHEDTDGDGKYDTHKVFVDGLNIATSCVRGRGGVWVSNPPYLLFYPDKNNDDVPDSAPEVHLSGFGLEDTHAVMNSLTWGPDGWLYGAQGSTCWATVSSAVTKDLHFKGQAIWRYHPDTKVFEVFAEGGGNTFCVEFDAKGRCYSGTNWGAVRGLHFVQGGRYIKGWGKHGPLMNPYSFGWFEHMPHEGYQPRFSHAVMLYEGGAMPALEGKMVSIIPLHNRIQVSEMVPWGSTFKTKDTIALMTAKDRWFRPVDIKAGPDGAIYVADWYDTRLSHVDPRDNWDKTHGRIYRISPLAPGSAGGGPGTAIASNAGKSAAPTSPAIPPAEPGANGKRPDLSKLASADLIARLASTNKWERQTAQRLLADRKDGNIAAGLRDSIATQQGQLALETLWAWHTTGKFESKEALAFMEHADPHVRRWVIRLLGDAGGALACYPMYKKGPEEKDLEVLSQMACSSRRFSFMHCIQFMAQRDDLAKDPHLPLLMWWAIEAKFSSNTQFNFLDAYAKPEMWTHPIVTDTILPRLAQRFASEPTERNLISLATLLERSPSPVQTKKLLAGVDAAFKGLTVPPLPGRLQSALAAAMRSVSTGADDVNTMILGIRAGDKTAVAKAIEYLKRDDEASQKQRIELIEVLGQSHPPEAAAALLSSAASARSHAVRREALSALSRFNDPKLGGEIVAVYDKLPKDQNVRAHATDALSKRKEWSIALLEAVDAGRIPREDVSFESIERMKLFRESAITRLIRKQWGTTRATVAEKQKQIDEVKQLVSAPGGDPKAGKEFYSKSCGLCHKLHGEGSAIGPDLTGYERDNLDFMLLAIIDPSAAIREEFITYEIETNDGLVLTGFLLEQNPKSVTIQDAVEGKVIVPRDEIVKLQASKTSRMPEKLLDPLTPEQIKDLFAYLRSRQAVK